MELKNIIKKEEILMNIEISSKFSMNFNDYIKLNKLLKNIGEITSNYFILMKEYDIKLKNDNLKLEERKEKLISFNDKLLSSDVEVNENEINSFIAKYNIS